MSETLLLGDGFNVFYFHPYLGKIPILDEHIFQMGGNHQTSFSCANCNSKVLALETSFGRCPEGGEAWGRLTYWIRACWIGRKKLKKKRKKNDLPTSTVTAVVRQPHLEHLSFVVLDETSVRQGEARPVIRSHGIDWMHGIDDRDPTFLGGVQTPGTPSKCPIFFRQLETLKTSNYSLKK